MDPVTLAVTERAPITRADRVEALVDWLDATYPQRAVAVGIVDPGYGRALRVAVDRDVLVVVCEREQLAQAAVDADIDVAVWASITGTGWTLQPVDVPPTAKSVRPPLLDFSRDPAIVYVRPELTPFAQVASISVGASIGTALAIPMIGAAFDVRYGWIGLPEVRLAVRPTMPSLLVVGEAELLWSIPVSGHVRIAPVAGVWGGVLPGPAGVALPELGVNVVNYGPHRVFELDVTAWGPFPRDSGAPLWLPRGRLRWSGVGRHYVATEVALQYVGVEYGAAWGDR